MIPFTIFKGCKILRTGLCNASDLDKQLLDDTEAVIAVASDPETQYVLNGAVYSMPEAPTELHYFDFEALEWRVSTEALSASVRLQRDALLRASDYTQLSDVIADKELWIEYRQKLRDLPLQAGYPVVIEWPDMPE